MHLKIGQKGEDMAVQYLINNGYQIVERNWSAGRGIHCVGEIDIVGIKDNVMHFVEVKCRANSAVSGDFSPQNAMTTRKIERISQAIEQYIAQSDINCEISIDLITVNIPFSGNTSLRHYINIV